MQLAQTAGKPYFSQETSILLVSDSAYCPQPAVLQRLKSLAWGEDAAKLVSIMAHARGIEPWAKAYQLLISFCSAKLQKPRYIGQLWGFVG
jgi:hypothetical protein